MKLNKNIALIWLCAVSFSWPSSAASQTPSNLEVLEKLLVKPMVSMVDSLVPADQPLLIRNEMETPLGNWITAELRRQFLQRNLDVRYPQDEEVSEAHYTLVLEESYAKIFYRGVDTDLLLRTSKYQRLLDTMLSFYIRNINESIAFSDSKTVSYSDTVSRSEMNEIENKLLSFTRGEKTGSSFIQKVFEPLVVTVATVGVVYLFFSLRSSS